MKTIQGINEQTVWIIEFHDQNPEDGLLDDISASFDTDPYDDEAYHELKYRFISVDTNDSKWDDAMDALGMTSNDFQGTFPVALVMRKRKGLFCWGFDLKDSIMERLFEVADEKVSPYA